MVRLVRSFSSAAAFDEASIARSCTTPERSLVDRDMFVQRLEEIVFSLGVHRPADQQTRLRLHGQGDGTVIGHARRVDMHVPFGRDIQHDGEVRARCDNLIGRVRRQRDGATPRLSWPVRRPGRRAGP